MNELNELVDRGLEILAEGSCFGYECTGFFGGSPCPFNGLSFRACRLISRFNLNKEPLPGWVEDMLLSLLIAMESSHDCG